MYEQSISRSHNSNKNTFDFLRSDPFGSLWRPLDQDQPDSVSYVLGPQLSLPNPFDLSIIYLSIGVFNIVYHIHDFHSNLHKMMLAILLTEKITICQESSIEPLWIFSKVFFLYFLSIFFFFDKSFIQVSFQNCTLCKDSIKFMFSPLEIDNVYLPKIH